MHPSFASNSARAMMVRWVDYYVLHTCAEFGAAGEESETTTTMIDGARGSSIIGLYPLSPVVFPGYHQNMPASCSAGGSITNVRVDDLSPALHLAAQPITALGPGRWHTR